MKLRIVLAALFLLSATGSAFASLGPPEKTDAWMVRQPVVVVGRVFDVAATDPHPLPLMSTASRYPSSRARIAIAEVLQNLSARPIAVGDTIDVYFVTANRGEIPGYPNIVQMTHDIACEPDFSRGSSGVEILVWTHGEWYWNCSLFEAERVKEAFRTFGNHKSSDDK